MFNATPLTGLGCRLGPENMVMSYSYCFFSIVVILLLNGFSVKTLYKLSAFDYCFMALWISIKSKMETHTKNTGFLGDIFLENISKYFFKV